MVSMAPILVQAHKSLSIFIMVLIIALHFLVYLWSVSPYQLNSSSVQNNASYTVNTQQMCVEWVDDWLNG